VTDSAISERLYAEASTAEGDKELAMVESAFHADFISGGPSQQALMLSTLHTIIAWLKARDAKAAS
jgi:hypothetical protein